MAEPSPRPSFGPTGQPTQEFYQYLLALDRAVRSLSPTTQLKALPPAQFPIVRASQS